MMPYTIMPPTVIGLKRAASMVLNPRKISADEALAIGLCSEVVTGTDLEQLVVECADELAGRDRIVVALGEAEIDRGLGMTLGTSELSQIAGFLHSITPSAHEKMHEYRRKIARS